MNTEIQTKTFVLTGPLAGKTLQINGRNFVNGRCQVTAPANLMSGAELYLGSYYQAFPEGSASLLAAQAKEEKSNGQRGVPPSDVEDQPHAVHGGVQQAGQGSGAEDPALGSADAGTASGPADGLAAGDGQPSSEAPRGDQVKAINAALQKLDPEVAEHWSEDHKPAVNVVSKLAGFPVTRSEIDAITGGAKNPLRTEDRQPLKKTK
jgi:hypothetical protein